MERVEMFTNKMSMSWAPQRVAGSLETSQESQTKALGKRKYDKKNKNKREFDLLSTVQRLAGSDQSPPKLTLGSGSLVQSFLNLN